MHPLTPARQNVIRVIRDEHETLAAVIHGMRYFVHALDQAENPPDLRAFRAMVFYLNGFPERVHHPKEDRFLFARLRTRTSRIDATLAALEYQHAQGAGLIHEIQHALARFESGGFSAVPDFQEMVEEYARFYFAHMALEEEVVFDSAAGFLTEQDWISIDAAFSGIHDPLTGALIRTDFTTLFSLTANADARPAG